MKLRFRVIGAFFLVALPGAAISVAAVGLFDRLIREEIELRASEVLDETQLVLESEGEELGRLVATAAERDPALLELVERPEDPELARRLEAWAAAEAAALRLDLLALVVKTEAGPELFSSAHLPMAVGDPPPPFARRLRPGETRTGFALELVEGNPPKRVPALVAVHAPPAFGGALWVYGGRRLDHRLLGRIARIANASIALEVPDRPPENFPRGQPPLERGSRSLIELAALGPGPGARIAVAVDVSRLWFARGQLLWLSGVLVVAALGTAFAAGVWLSARITHPIVALAHAAERVGRGDLDVRVIARSRDEVGALVTVFNRMTVELREARGRIQRAERIAAWREVARRLAHEIKNPLSPMRLGMQNLRKAWAKQHPALGEILEESTRSVLDEVASLDRLVTDFSAFARLPAPELRPVAPLDVLESVARLYDARVRLDREAVAERALPTVLADPEQLGRALVNLVKNGLEAAGEAGRIELDARRARAGDRAGILLEVADDGPGMPPETLAEARGVYFTTKPGGTGLGLAIVERTAEEHGGCFTLDSTPGAGTVARLWLPLPAEARPAP